MSRLYAYKPLKDRALRPLAVKLKAAGLTPNMVTAAGLFLSVAAGIAAAYGHLYEGIALFLAGACLDALDGSFARSCGLSSGFGRYFDSLCDRGSELAFVAGAVVGGAPYAALAVVAGSIAQLAARVYNHRKGISSDAATFSRPERLALLTVGLLIPAPFATALFALSCFLCLGSSAQILSSATRTRRHKKADAQERFTQEICNG